MLPLHGRIESMATICFIQTKTDRMHLRNGDSSIFLEHLALIEPGDNPKYATLAPSKTAIGQSRSYENVH